MPGWGEPKAQSRPLACERCGARDVAEIRLRRQGSAIVRLCGECAEDLDLDPED